MRLDHVAKHEPFIHEHGSHYMIQHPKYIDSARAAEVV